MAMYIRGGVGCCGVKEQLWCSYVYSTACEDDVLLWKEVLLENSCLRCMYVAEATRRMIMATVLAFE